MPHHDDLTKRGSQSRARRTNRIDRAAPRPAADGGEIPLSGADPTGDSEPVVLLSGCFVASHWEARSAEVFGAPSIVLSSGADSCELGLVDAVELDDASELELWPAVRVGSTCIAGRIIDVRDGPMPRTAIVQLVRLSTVPRLEIRVTTRENARIRGFVVEGARGERWLLLDLHPRGFSMSGLAALDPGRRLDVTVAGSAQRVSGTVVVRHCVRAAVGDAYRCGVEVTRESSALRSFLGHESAELHREQIELLTELRRRMAHDREARPLGT